jgi:butyryl-CoA dehydrogenase
MKLPTENSLGEQGQEFEIFLFWIALKKLEKCAACVGLAQAALDEAIKYAKITRIREKAISNMQGIRWILADIESKVGTPRWFTHRSASMKDIEAKGLEAKVARAKLFMVPTCVEVIERARYIHGAYGY